QPSPILADERERVIDEARAYQMVNILEGVVERGTGRRARAIGKPVAGKTGTSQENRDGWFAGFTCGLTTVVWLGHAGEEIPMYDFRKPLAEGEVDKPRNEAGELIDDRGWPNIEGGNFPAMIWSDYMKKATAGLPPCPEISTSQEFTGSRLNQDLSTTTLPPCGVELDDFGFPRGNGPEDFILVTTTTAAPTTPPASAPEGLPVQDDGDGNPNTTAPCVPLDQWIFQADPEARLTSTTQPGETTVPGQSTQPGETTAPDGNTTSSLVLPTTLGSTAPTTTAPPEETTTTPTTAASDE
ncbi:MAG: penicillin-binding transpeptidase domain-containing protein, partial [Actinomycetota bacterium]